MLKNVKNTTFISPLDLLAPHSCRGCGRIGSPLCDRCKNYIISERQNLCPNCKTPKTAAKCPHCRNLPPIFIAGLRNSLLGDLIHDLKFNSVRSLARPLAELLDHALEGNIKSPIIIVPLPTISRHIRERGLDHTYLVAKHLTRLHRQKPNTYRVQKLLTRAKDTVQVGTDASTRKTQAANAYAINPKIKIDPTATYLLLDDVWTTGASMLAAHQTLHQAGAKNITLAVLALSTFDQQ